MCGPDPGRPDWLVESRSEPGSFDNSWPVQRLVGIGRGGTSGRPSIFDRNCNSGEPL